MNSLSVSLAVCGTGVRDGRGGRGSQREDPYKQLFAEEIASPDDS